MKRNMIIFSIVLLFSMVYLTACGNSEIEEPQEVVLTPDNIEDYMVFDVTNEEPEYETIVGLPVTNVVLNLETYLTSPGQLSNVVVNGELHCRDPWYFNSGEKNYDENNTTCIRLEIKLPVDAKHSESHTIDSMGYYSPDGSYYFVVTSVEGSFIPE